MSERKVVLLNLLPRTARLRVLPVPFSVEQLRRAAIGVCLAITVQACSSAVEPDPTPRGAVGILPLGNSITQANISHLSYRHALWTRMIDAGIEFDFVGSVQEHVDGRPNYPTHAGRSFDPDHEGHWGWRADEILSGRGSDALPDWLNIYDADIVLMHLGTNDVFEDNDHESTIAELREIVAALRADNPSVVILWALLIPTTDPAVSPGINELNTLVQPVALELNTTQSPVRVVDLNEGFDAAAMTYDGTHPNAVGEAWMADRWFAAVQDVLPLIP